MCLSLQIQAYVYFKHNREGGKSVTYDDLLAMVPVPLKVERSLQSSKTNMK